MENGRQVVGRTGRPMRETAGPPLRVNAVQPVEMSISILRGLASAGYFNSEQLSGMERVLREGEDGVERPRNWLTISEACCYARISRSTLWRYSQSGLILIHRLQGRRLVDQHELEALIAASQNEPQGTSISCS